MQKMHIQSLPAIFFGKRRVVLSRDSFTDPGENDIEIIERFLTYGPHTLLVLLASETKSRGAYRFRCGRLLRQSLEPNHRIVPV